MIAGLPWTAWLLLLAGIGSGLAIVIRFYIVHRPRRGDGAGVGGGTADGAAVDEAAVDGAAVDGAVVDGAAIDGDAVDDGAAVDGAPDRSGRRASAEHADG